MGLTEILPRFRVEVAIESELQVATKENYMNSDNLGRINKLT